MAFPPEATRRIAGVATFGVVIVANALAGSGALSGESIGVIANRYPNAFLPASYTFGIWSLIYLALAAFTVDQAVRPRPDSLVQRRLAWHWPVNGALNVAWIVSFSFSRFWLAMAAMVALLANLIVIHRSIGDPRRLGRRDLATTALPFQLYLAWISVALIANAFQLATVVQWSGLGVPEEVWSVVMMAAATALGAFMALARGVLVFPLVVAWALAGIAVRHASEAWLAIPAWSLVVVGLLVALFAGLARAREALVPGATAMASR